VSVPDSSRTIYDGRLLHVVVEQWGDREREVVAPPDAVAVVAIDVDGNVALVRQLREAVRKEVLELPAGGIEAGETPLQCARRELVEETGLTGGEWRHWGGFFTTPGYSRERMELFFAEGVTRGERAAIAGEDLAYEGVPLADLPDLLPSIEDAKTLTGLLLYLRQLESAPPR
jgi:ADP-ribose pyrophosphatase